eukprot:CAMPEP_0115750022 /NCGR_PEP_ID=MMETSP0272-20121206/94501_1 /TAXON_ID=71861 /ORGANISM="Scrippsiella trochoidea, Strain CCMP3099" /LENGTH=33 /DNA_ID= /DNA_START= /DNA_END= /DNA_ORIENTATION=
MPMGRCSNAEAVLGTLQQCGSGDATRQQSRHRS